MSPRRSAASQAASPQFKIGMLVTQRETISPTLWRIVDLEGRIASLEPISLGATKGQSPLSDLRRYQIKITDQVFRNEELVHIRQLTNPRADDVYEYEVEFETDKALSTVRETELKVHVGSQAPDPLSMLKSLDASPAPMAWARAELINAYFDATARSLGIVGYNGARMLPIPHQIAAARYTLNFGRTRFLLADEVGLGKTIEAGLIVSTIRKYFPDWQTAFFVPESLTVQWAFEMYAKFGKAIFRLDEDEEPEEGEPDPGVILPHARGLKWGRARTKNPEILVIDEAHQILRDESLYEAFLKLSRTAKAVLLLTATPTSEDGEALPKLLRLVDPKMFEEMDRKGNLASLIDKQEQVETMLTGLRNPETSGEDLRKLWQETGFEDSELEARLLSLLVDPTDMNVRAKIAALVTDRYYPRARLLRYQRKFLVLDNEMAERVEEPVEYAPDKPEKRVRELVGQWLDLVREQNQGETPAWQEAAAVLMQASHSSPLAVDQWLQARDGSFECNNGVTADPVRRYRELLESLERLPGEDWLLEEMRTATNHWIRQSRSVDMKARHLARLPRYQALLKQLHSLMNDHLHDPLHALIFTSFEVNVRPLYLLLNKALGEDVEVFYISAELEWREREKNAFAFQECKGPSVLISDELGGEGRNFQFANVLFHFDLPMAAWMLEQRIGRLDRVGRDPELDIDSQVLLAPGYLDEAIYNFHREAVSVFNDSLAPVENQIEDVSKELLQTVMVKGGDGVADLIDPVANRMEEQREKEALGLLKRRGTGVEEVKTLVPLLEDERQLRALGEATVQYARLLGSIVDRNGDQATITIGSHHPLTAFTGILSEMQGVFNRKEAVRHERLEFFSPGHPFVRSMTRLAVQDSTDRVGFAAREGIKKGGFLFVVRVHLPQAFLEAVRELPDDVQPAIFCSAGGKFPTTIYRVVVDFDGKVVEDKAAEPYLEPLRRGEQSLDEGPEVLQYLPEDWGALAEKAQNQALEIGRDQARAAVAANLPDLTAHLSEVLTRHFGSEFPVEGQLDALLFELDPLTVEVDAVLVQFPG